MANAIRLRITGMVELRDAIRLYGLRVVKATFDAARTAVTEATREAQAAAPRGKTGTLRIALASRVTSDGYAVRGTMYTRQTKAADAFYASFVEFGTRRSGARPFFVPAAQAARKRLNDALATAVVQHAPAGLGRPRITGEGPRMPAMGADR